MSAVLEASGITFSFFENAPPVLTNINLSLKEGTVTLLRGKSGCGKSTLAYVLSGLYPENGGKLISGNVTVNGADVHKMNAGKRVSYVGMLFQNCDLQFCTDTLRTELEFCAENLKIAQESENFVKITKNHMQNTNFEKKTSQISIQNGKKAPIVSKDENHALYSEDFSAKIVQITEKAGVSHLLDRKFAEMSGGEKQKCAFSCLLLLQSRVLILDEAFANVDFETARELALLVKKSGLTVLAIDHNRDIWDGLLDREIFLDNSPERADFSVKTEKKRGEILIETRNLCINGILYPDMIFEKGCITAITGQSGRGKTTLFKTLIGQNSYEGSILFSGKELREYSGSELFSKIGLVFQNPANQFLTLSVFDEICFSVRASFKASEKANKKKRKGFFTFHLSRSEREALNQQAETRAQKMLGEFALERYALYPPYLLSQGQQRRLAVLSMTAGAQDLLLLDEPTYGQDFENSTAVMNLLVERAARGFTVVFNTHNKKTALAFADKIISLDEDAANDKTEKK